MNFDQMPTEGGWAVAGAALLYFAQRIRHFMWGNGNLVEIKTLLAVMDTRLAGIERWQVEHTKADSQAVGTIQQQFREINEKVDRMLGREEVTRARTID